ncbi:MAG: DUF6064 family protein [Acidobacteriota bacterium]
MSEWWTYTLSDFLLFSPRTYYRLFEIFNAAIWPAQVATTALGLAILLLVRRGTAVRARAVAAILAVLWLFVAIAFHAHRYATINTAGLYFAWAFGLEAALLIWKGVVRSGLSFEPPAGAAGRAGLGIFLFALAVGPFFGPLLGRGWRGVEIFGAAPDPTAIATLGLLLLARVRHRWLLMVIPVLWCLTTGIFLLAMRAADAWVAPGASLAAVTLATWQARMARRAGNPSRNSPSSKGA